MSLDQIPTSFGFRANKPLRLRLGPWVDVVLISDAEQIQWLNEHPDLERKLDPSASVVHRIVSRRLYGDLGFEGGALPVFRSRSEEQRAAQQKAFDKRFEDLRGAPGEARDAIGAFIAGEKSFDEIGVQVQEWAGRLFKPHYKSTRELFEAGRLLAGWPSAMPWKTIADRANGKLARAKEAIAAASDNDLHAIHATSIGMERVARTVRNLRKAAQVSSKQALSPDDILRECLVAPPAVLRGCKREVSAPFLDRPLGTQTLVVFLVARAFALSGDLDVAFLADGWSRCPAHRVVPEMLRSVWHAAHHDELNDKPLLSTINDWSRRWQRAVS
jgi:hypothetical protein